MSGIWLPDIRKNFVFHPLFILAVAFEAFFQNSFLVAYSLGDERDIEQHNQEGDGRSQHQGQREEEDDCGRVHRVTDDAVEPRVDDLLVFLYLDSAGEVGVFAEHYPIQDIAENEECGGEPHGPFGQHQPLEAPVESRNHKCSDKHPTAKRHNGLLLLLFFFGIQSFTEQIRILHHQQQTSHEHWRKKTPYHQPSLPIVERTRRQEDEQSEDDDPEEEFG